MWCVWCGVVACGVGDVGGVGSVLHGVWCGWCGVGGV